MATVAQLGARTLRKLGVSLVASAQRPAQGSTLTAMAVVNLAIRQLGILVPEFDRPALTVITTADDIATRALRAVGINPISSFHQLGGAVTGDDIAQRALRMVGANVVDQGYTYQTDQIYSSTDVAYRVLRKLEIYDPTELPTDVDLLEAQYKVFAVHDTLAAMDYVSWSRENIPASAAEWYVTMAAQLLAADFGKPSNAEAYDFAQADKLRVMSLSGASAQSRAQQKVVSVFNELQVLGLSNWDYQNIPFEVVEAMVVMVAQLLAPTYGKPFEQTLYDAAMMRLRRIAISGPRGHELALYKVAATHDALVTNGLVTWTVDAIPQAYAEDYVVIAAGMLAPIVATQAPAEREATLAERKAAMDRVRQGVMDDGVTERALAKFRSVHDEMNGMGIVSWDPNAIPAAMSDAYASMIANELAPDFGKETDPKAMEAGFQRIRMLALNGPAGQALAEQKVRAVHASLDARGLTRWSLWDISDFAEEPYVFMAAALLGPEFGIKVDPNWIPAAEADLKRIISVPTSYEPMLAAYF